MFTIDFGQMVAMVMFLVLFDKAGNLYWINAYQRMLRTTPATVAGSTIFSVPLFCLWRGR